MIKYQHQSAVSFDLLNDPLMVQKAYGIFIESILVEYKAFKFTAFVTNLCNTHDALALSDVFGNERRALLANSCRKIPTDI